MVSFKRGDLILNFDRIRMDVTDFIRGNPLTAVAVGLGVPITFGGIAAIGRSVGKRRKKKVSKKKVMGRRIKRKKVTRKRKKVTHRSPRHKGHKRVSFVTKDGKRVNFLVKKPKHSHKRIRRR